MATVQVLGASCTAYLVNAIATAQPSCIIVLSKLLQAACFRHPSYISTLSPSDLTKGILVEMRKMREIRRIDANSKKRESEKDENGDRDCITAQAK